MINKKILSKLIEFSVADSNSITYNFKHFSYLLMRNKIISIGRNNPDKTHPLAKKFNHRFNCIHSELSSIVNFKFKFNNITLNKCKLVNIRISAANTPKMARPCSMCIEMLKFFDIKEVYYTNSLGNFERISI